MDVVEGDKEEVDVKLSIEDAPDDFLTPYSDTTKEGKANRRHLEFLTLVIRFCNIIVSVAALPLSCGGLLYAGVASLAREHLDSPTYFAFKISALKCIVLAGHCSWYGHRAWGFFGGPAIHWYRSGRHKVFSQNVAAVSYFMVLTLFLASPPLSILAFSKNAIEELLMSNNSDYGLQLIRGWVEVESWVTDYAVIDYWLDWFANLKIDEKLQKEGKAYQELKKVADDLVWDSCKTFFTVIPLLALLVWQYQQQPEPLDYVVSWSILATNLLCVGGLVFFSVLNVVDVCARSSARIRRQAATALGCIAIIGVTTALRSMCAVNNIKKNLTHCGDPLGDDFSLPFDASLLLSGLIIFVYVNGIYSYRLYRCHVGDKPEESVVATDKDQKIDDVVV